MNQNPLTHLSPEGGVRMVDVSEKPVTAREAVARGKVVMNPKTLSLIAQGRVPKGDVLGVAQVAGIMAAKKTPDLIPLCHPLELGGIEVRLSLERDEVDGAQRRADETQIEPGKGSTAAVLVEAHVKVRAQTGAEMEALTAVSAACLTVYDMCKSVDKSIIISDVRLVAKRGGKSGAFMREGESIG